MYENVKTNSHGTNANIKAHILPDERMKQIGFYKEINGRSLDHWVYHKFFKIEKLEIDFSVNISFDGTDVWVDVLDDDFLQPYDYQQMLEFAEKRGLKPNKYAVNVCQRVEQEVDFLQSVGVISGHHVGEYI